MPQEGTALAGQAREQLDGVLDARQGLHLLAHGFGSGTIARIVEHRSDRITDALRGAPVGTDHLCNAEGRAALSAVGLVAGDGDHDEGYAAAERLLGAVEAAVRDQERAARQQLRQGQVALEAHVGGLGTQASRILVLAHRNQEADGLVAQAFQDALANRRVPTVGSATVLTSLWRASVTAQEGTEAGTS